MNEMKTWSFNGTQFEVVDEEARRRAVPEGGAEGQFLTSDAEGNAGWAEVEIPESAQADWNVSDATDPAYVNNRTHYTDSTVVMEASADPDGSGNVSGNGYVYFLLSSETIDAGDYALRGGIEQDSITCLATDGSSTLYVPYSGWQLISVTGESAYVSNYEVGWTLHHGTYLKTDEGNQPTEAVEFDVVSEVIAQLAERYIPDSLIERIAALEKRAFTPMVIRTTDAMSYFYTNAKDTYLDFNKTTASSYSIAVLYVGMVGDAEYSEYDHVWSLARWALLGQNHYMEFTDGTDSVTLKYVGGTVTKDDDFVWELG